MTVRTAELLSFVPQSSRATALFGALERAAPAVGVHVVRTPDFRGGSDVLVLWGPGAPNRVAPMRAQREAGGHVVAFDLAYWQREFKARVSIDAPHPQAWVMRRAWPSTRLAADGIACMDRWNPSGPVVIAGLGDKARVQYGANVVDMWEQAMADACATRWPNRAVVYRRKRPGASVPGWARLASDGPIDTALTGASLVVTWHSNVAIDAIRLGIPAICRDGAAAAVCASKLGTEEPRPLDAVTRATFLANLAWFQWAPAEASACWAFLREVLA